MSLVRPVGRVAVLGAGMAGVSTAIFLARRGYHVTLYEEMDTALSGASRWNEGRIHLGYVYGADTTLNTAKHLLPGGLSFKPLVEELLEERIAPSVTQGDDRYLVHRKSVIAADPLEANLHAINDLVRSHPDAAAYLDDASNARVHRMSESELRNLTDSPDITAGFHVMERSIETQWLCDRLLDVVTNTPGLTLRTGARVLSATPVRTEDGPWRVATPEDTETFDLVVNTAWNGLLEIDKTAGLPLNFEWSHRYRISLFATTKRNVPVGSMFVAVGPFGIFKNHNDRIFYMSWYQTGLRTYTEGLSAIRPAPMTKTEAVEFIDRTRGALERLMPPVAEVFANVETLRLEGGFVLAQGTGRLDDPAASLHKRDKFGVRRRGNFLSVDTGKFATAPWVARRVADMVTGEGRLSQVAE
ncbi:FAD-dependent oxidoreductase [Palleronia sp. KMU-117]|uniref:FAD-dependent oxidoreductase n=1 Tax=Palleronia sp. KMU-117 TaxID=3434108 RepID=UPI003D73954A